MSRRKFLSTCRFNLYNNRNFSITVQNVENLASSSSNTLSNIPSYMDVHNTDKWPSEILKSISKDIVIVDDFVNDIEEAQFVTETKVPLKRLRYENTHWDDAIQMYREIERKNWGPICQQVIERMRRTAFSSQAQHLPLVHVLDVAAEGCVKPHIDSVRYCGNVIAGVSLLTDSVMRLVHEKRQELILDLMLKRKSLYILRGIGRYDFTHEILPNGRSYFKNVEIHKNRRISIICRESSGSSESYLNKI